MKKDTLKEDMMLDKFQYTVANLLVRNKSILDGMTKFQDSCSSVNRAIVKSVTQCGCSKINASKQEVNDNMSLEDLKNSQKTHFEGELCKSCRDIVEKEMGQTLFYLASLCNTLDLNLYDIVIKELDRVELLGNYSLR